MRTSETTAVEEDSTARENKEPAVIRATSKRFCRYLYDERGAQLGVRGYGLGACGWGGVGIGISPCEPRSLLGVCVWGGYIGIHTLVFVV